MSSVSGSGEEMEPQTKSRPAFGSPDQRHDEADVMVIDTENSEESGSGSELGEEDERRLLPARVGVLPDINGQATAPSFDSPRSSIRDESPLLGQPDIMSPSGITPTNVFESTDELGSGVEPLEPGDDAGGAILAQLSDRRQAGIRRIGAMLDTLRRRRGIDRYMEDFSDAVAPKAVVVGSIPRDIVEAQERTIEAARLREIATQEKQMQLRFEAIESKENRARSSVLQAQKDLQKRNKRMYIEQAAIDRRRMGALHENFTRAENRLKSALNKRQGEVAADYGELQYDPRRGLQKHEQGRTFLVDWSRTPQPIQVKVRMVRAVREKLPRGRYAMLVSVFDRLSGHALRWSQLKGSEWTGVTMPVQFDGRYNNWELKIDQSVFTIAPSRPDMLPDMVMIFELFLLRGPASPIDKVVAWGAFPLCDSKKEATIGNFKTPLLHGGVDPSVVTYQRLEDILANDLDSWVANLYFEVHAMPRYRRGQQEYEVELQNTSELLVYPDRDSESESEISDIEEEADATASGGALLADTKKAGKGQLADGVMAATRGWFDRSRVGRMQRKEMRRKRVGQRGRKGFWDDDPMHELENYSYAIPPPKTPVDKQKVLNRLDYTLLEIRTEYGLRRWKTLEFWIMILLFIASFYIRILVHYLGQYVWLGLNNVPISRFDMDAAWLNLDYIGVSVPVYVEVGAVAIPVLFNIALFAILAVVQVGIYAVFPRKRLEYYSRFVMTFGLCATLDWLFTFIVDTARGAWTRGDGFKLWTHWQYQELAGVTGAVITLVLYAALFCAGAFLLYYYLSRVHMNGRLSDLHRRLHAPNGAFFIPYDNELSVSELRDIAERSERWRGEGGQRRRVVVMEYIQKQHSGTDDVEGGEGEGEERAGLLDIFRKKTLRTVHLAIYVVHLDYERTGRRDLHRHFVVSSDGAVMELCGSDANQLSSTEYFILSRALQGRGIEGTPTTVEDFLAHVRNPEARRRMEHGKSSVAGTPREMAKYESVISEQRSVIAGSTQASSSRLPLPDRMAMRRGTEMPASIQRPPDHRMSFDERNQRSPQ